MLSTLAPHRRDASRCTVASRFRCHSEECGIHCPRVPEQSVTSPLCLPSSRTPLLGPSPLRTVLKTFAIYGSSPSNARLGKTRLRNRKFLRLHDTHLKSSNVAVDDLPIDGKPFRRIAGDCTNSLHCRHLRCLQSRFLRLSRVKDQGNVCPLSRPVMLSVWLTQPVSTSLQRGIRFFSFRTPATLSIGLTAFLPLQGTLRVLSCFRRSDSIR